MHRGFCPRVEDRGPGMILLGCIRQTAYQAAGIVGFEFMRIHVQEEQVGYSVGANAGFKARILNKGIERYPPALPPIMTSLSGSARPRSAMALAPSTASKVSM